MTCFDFCRGRVGSCGFEVSMDGNAKHDQRCHEQDTMDRLAQCDLTSGANPLDVQLQGRDNNICCKDGKVGVDLCFDASLLVINEVIN